MKLQDALHTCQQQKKAILATNFYNLETLQAIVQAAQQRQALVILQLTQSSIHYIGLQQAVQMGRQALADYGLQGWIHLDHGGSIEVVQRCLDAGFDSVMIDASEKPLVENIATTQRVVEMARPYHANVEAELGYVAKLGQTQGGGFTTPDDAQRFVAETGVDALAVAIGSAHGFYKQPPHLDIPRLQAIHEATPVPLVLHGSSGIPDSMIQAAIQHGICKVNLATEIKDTFMRTLRQQLLTSDEIDLRKVFPKATAPVVQMLTQKYNNMQP